MRQRIALESAKDLNTIIFDKTGTLTKGEQGVVQVAVDGIAEADALRIAAGLEGDSEHMIAEAIRTYVEERNISPASVSRFESIAGRGVKAVVDSITYYIGGP
ncbi:HAD family hydrolase, partial [Kamptonema cortianum]|nr:HAD family hydrolase [Kamptonema cortianum]